ncbi:MAG: WD40 repeat domain-containing serine/threonine protein kinase [Limisphaerales bacterium]
MQGLKIASDPAPSSWEAGRDDLPRQFGDYELLEEIARGGMGVIYRARQRSLDRIVAVKMLLFGPHASAEYVKRFRAEASAAASLQHPNIVAIHEVGVHQGEHYLVMDLVEGPSLAKFIQDQPLPTRRVAGYLNTIAEAIHYAHERGILHRDLKPSNVLIDPNDQPRVTDFGLAKRMEGDSSLTRSGHVLGSPSYMPPEQAGETRHKVGRRSDVYSLGAMLYHALVGRPPFVGEGLSQTLDQVFNREPVSPRLLNPDVARDLDTICLKCLEKDPARRYPTAQALADELGRWLRHEPVQARALGHAGRLWRWARRKPALATLIVLVHLVAAIGLGGILWQWQRAEGNGIELRRNLYAADMRNTQQALVEHNLGRALELLDQHRPRSAEDDLRGWEWRYLWKQCRPDAGMSLLCARPSGIASLAVSPDGRWLAVGEEEGGQVSVWDLQTRSEVTNFRAGAGSALVAFSPREPLLAMVNGRGVSGFFAPNLQSTARFWQASSREPVPSFPLGGACRRPIHFSGDGQSLLTSLNIQGVGNPICFWRVADGQKQTSYPVPMGGGNNGPVWPSAIAGDMSVLACGAPGGNLHVVDWASLTNRWKRQTDDEVVAVAISADGKLLASSSGLGYSAISLWDVASGSELRRLEGHRGWVSALVFWPDGKTLASSSGDQTIRLWDLTHLDHVPPPRVLVGQQSELWNLVLLPDARTLVSGSEDGSVYLWDTAADPRAPDWLRLSPKFTAWCFTPDSLAVLTVDPAGEVARWRGTEFNEKEDVMTVPQNWGARISQDARRLAIVLRRGPIQVWDLEQQTLICQREFREGLYPGAPLRFMAGGNKLLVAFDRTALIQEWDLATDQRTASWRSRMEPDAFSPDERRCLVLRPNGETALRDLATGRETKLGIELTQPGYAAFSPDGHTFAAPSWMGWIKLWDAVSWKEIGTLRGFLQGAHSVAFSPDGQRLVAGGSGHEAIKVWSTDGYQELLTLKGEGSVFLVPTFSPDGHILGAVNWDGRLHLWRAPSWEEIDAAEKAASRGASPDH